MTEFCCKNCNAPLDMAEAKNGVIVCAFCGSVFTLPKKEQPPAVVKALDFGYAALDKCRFDDAYTHFASAAELDGSEPEAYWGKALSKFRVQYLRDTVNNRLQPICHEVAEESFTSDPDYKRALTLATEEQLRECNLGYRAKYVLDTARKVCFGDISLNSLHDMTYKAARKELLGLYGVGEKVADCICLFGLHQLDAFPVDTHIRQALDAHYKRGFPNRRYKGCRGVMQQYIFYYELMK